MKSSNSKKYLIYILCFVLGASVMFVAQRYIFKPTYPLQTSFASIKPMDPFFDRFFNDDFFGRSRDPFEEMRRMREGMIKQFEQDEGGGLFDSWYKKKFGGGNAGDITRREDDHFVYYDIAVDGLRQEKVNVKVENGQLTISGQVEKKSEEGNSGSYFKSSFQRSFPVPSNVDSGKFQLEQGKEKLVVKFPKIRTKNS